METWIKKSYQRLTELEKIMLLSAAFSTTLLLVRIIVTREWLFAFLPWNMLLAYIPYWITRWLTFHPDRMEKKSLFIPALILWILFIPNSFYIITDLFHFNETADAPRWFDLTLLFSFAWNGILPGVVSVYKMEIIVVDGLRLNNRIYFLLPIMWLIALGIYIGRYLRYNSWDIITDPFSLIGDITWMIIHPLRHGYAWGMIACFGVFMTIIYISIRRLSAAIR